MFSVAHARQFVAHVLPAVIRPLRVVWNQVIGFFFLALAVAALPRVIHSAREFNGEPGSLFRLLLSGIFIAFMTGFGIHSFWRAHRVPKLR
ncbi:MAG: hypothetical protein ABSH46_21065 [Bryobacteraceae bacterium]|jgi:hypothetical protein